MFARPAQWRRSSARSNPQVANAQPLFYSIAYTAQAVRYTNDADIALFTYDRNGEVAALTRSAHRLLADAGASRLGIFEESRAGRYQREATKLAAQLDRLTSRLRRREQSWTSTKRMATVSAAELLRTAGDQLAGMERLALADRRREDSIRVAREAIAAARKLLT